MKSLSTKIIKHAVFDAYGTLFDVHSAVSRHQVKLGEKAQIVSNLWRVKQLEYTWLRTLMGCYENFFQVTQDALDFAFDANGISDIFLRKELLNAYKKLSCYPEVPGVIRCIKKQGLRTAILSNGTQEMLESGVRNSDLKNYFDKIFSADAIRVFKPDHRVYKLALDELECNPEEILFFSSNAWDISGASNFGFKTVWVNRFGQKFERLPGEPLLELKTLNSFLEHFPSD